MRGIDMIGHKYGHLIILERLNNLKALVQCVCNKQFTCYVSNLRSQQTISCGCIKRLRTSQRCLVDLSGRQFGRLSVIERVSDIGIKPVKWDALCNCGNKVIVDASHLKSGHTKSCGCLSIEKARERFTKHGYRKSFIYSRWRAMLNRCLNKNLSTFKYYGGRGITVDSRWLSFENFIKDMGMPEKHLEIDRIDNNGHYTPLNCRWVSHKENCNNRRNNKRIQQ